MPVGEKRPLGALAQAAVDAGYDLVAQLVTDRKCRCGGDYFVGNFRRGTDVRTLVFHTEPRCEQVQTYQPRAFLDWNTAPMPRSIRGGSVAMENRAQRRARARANRKRNRKAGKP